MFIDDTLMKRIFGNFPELRDQNGIEPSETVFNQLAGDLGKHVMVVKIMSSKGIDKDAAMASLREMLVVGIESATKKLNERLRKVVDLAFTPKS